VDAAAIECTLVGPELRLLRDTVVAIAGANLGAVVRPSGRRLASNATHDLRAGEVLAMPGATDTESGARAYLALPGGLDVPVVLSSRSTCLAAAFGGFEGRPLRSGDRLRPMSAAPPAGAGLAWPSQPGEPRPADTVRILPGPALQGDEAGAEASARTLAGGTWTVAPASDRQAIRLTGVWAADPPAFTEPGGWLSHGVIPGTVQLPPDGRPIVLLADAQPTGGYPVVAVVIAADLPVLGQLAPGDPVRFETVSRLAARDAWRERGTALTYGRGRLRSSKAWDDLWQSAGS
jgi:antagonist of KipI